VDAHLYIRGVKEVFNQSPGHVAGLIPSKDYVLGTDKITFKDIDQFAKYIEINEN
jgi:hypothetical protein